MPFPIKPSPATRARTPMALSSACILKAMVPSFVDRRSRHCRANTTWHRHSLQLPCDEMLRGMHDRSAPTVRQTPTERHLALRERLTCERHEFYFVGARKQTAQRTVAAAPAHQLPSIFFSSASNRARSQAKATGELCGFPQPPAALDSASYRPN